MSLRLGQSELVNLLPTKADFLDARKAPFSDLFAGFTVALVALPLALAFGVASGLGASAGITTAIIAGAIAAVFGGSRLQVSGPTGAMTVVLVPIFLAHGSSGVLFVGLVAGVLLLLMATLKLGSHVHRLPTSLIEGFTAGIAVVISLQQLPNFFGVAVNGQDRILAFAWQTVADATQNFSRWPDMTAPALALFVGSCIWLGARYRPQLPLALVIIALVTVASNLMGLGVAEVGELPAQIGKFDLSFLIQNEWMKLLLPAMAVAALAALESLLSAKVADRMRGSGETHDSNRELFGQGLANLVTPLFGGVAATAALARTAVNVRANAQSKLAAFSHAAFLAVSILLFAPLVGQIPLAALAGVLLATTVHMIKPSELKRTASTSRLDALVLWTTFVATIALDLVSAVLLGVLLTVVLRKTKLANLSRRAPLVDEGETLGD